MGDLAKIAGKVALVATGIFIGVRAADYIKTTYEYMRQKTHESSTTNEIVRMRVVDSYTYNAYRFNQFREELK
jgi:hypothetical protein